MDEDILVGLRNIVAQHPWWTARAGLIVALLEQLKVLPPATILEAGCGWGTNLEALEAAGYRVTGLDVSRRMLDRLDRADRQLVEADLSQGLPDHPPTYESVLALDVIEHLDDDRQALRQLGKLLKKNGRLIISVPALPELFSEFDEVQGHRRRYTARSLRNCLEESSLKVEHVLWWGQWMVRPLQRRKSATRRRPGDANVDVYRRYLALPPWPGSWAMNIMLRLDHRRTLRGRNTFGTSLIAIAHGQDFEGEL